MKFLRIGFTLFAFSRLAYADPAEDLAAALRRLEVAANYAWDTTVDPSPVSAERIENSPELKGSGAKSVMASQPIFAVSDRRMGTVYTSSRYGTHLAVRAVTNGRSALIERNGDWLAQEETERQIALLPTPMRLADSRPLTLGRYMLALKPPAEELAALLADANPAMHTGKTLTATLSEATAKRFVHELRFRDGMNPAPTPPSFAEGSIEFWIEAGWLTKYVVTLQTEAPRPHSTREYPLLLIKTTTLKGFNRTPVRLPAAAAKMLNR